MSEPLDELKGPLKDFTKAKEVWEATKHSETCPSCGYCPHCGRRNAPYNPFVVPYVRPYWPPTPDYVTWGTSTTTYPLLTA